MTENNSINFISQLANYCGEEMTKSNGGEGGQLA